MTKIVVFHQELLKEILGFHISIGNVSNQSEFLF
jgi:hypothetical protein